MDTSEIEILNPYPVANGSHWGSAGHPVSHSMGTSILRTNRWQLVPGIKPPLSIAFMENVMSDLMCQNETLGPGPEFRLDAYRGTVRSPKNSTISSIKSAFLHGQATQESYDCHEIGHRGLDGRVRQAF